MFSLSTGTYKVLQAFPSETITNIQGLAIAL